MAALYPVKTAGFGIYFRDLLATGDRLYVGGDGRDCVFFVLIVRI